MAKIVAPNSDYNGQIGDVVFQDGVAETDNQAVISYCRTAGYEVDGRTNNPDALPQAQVDSSKTHQALGTPLRDAAVDQKPGDFLPPVNAGQADPHGPEVVSPEIHGSEGPVPIVPGLVSSDPAEQEAREMQAASLALVDQLPAGDVTEQLVASDPQTDEPETEQPAGNASQADWADWVIATHPDLDEAQVRATKRDDLRETYGN